MDDHCGSQYVKLTIRKSINLVRFYKRNISICNR